jgi:hypothetical protein
MTESILKSESLRGTQARELAVQLTSLLREMNSYTFVRVFSQFNAEPLETELSFGTFTRQEKEQIVAPLLHGHSPARLMTVLAQNHYINLLGALAEQVIKAKMEDPFEVRKFIDIAIRSFHGVGNGHLAYLHLVRSRMHDSVYFGNTPQEQYLVESLNYLAGAGEKGREYLRLLVDEPEAKVLMSGYGNFGVEYLARARMAKERLEKPEPKNEEMTGEIKINFSEVGF